MDNEEINQIEELNNEIEEIPNFDEIFSKITNEKIAFDKYKEEILNSLLKLDVKFKEIEKEKEQTLSSQTFINK
jgi:hypothetical protein